MCSVPTIQPTKQSFFTQIKLYARKKNFYLSCTSWPSLPLSLRILQFCFSFLKVSKLYAVSPSCLLCLFFRGVWRSLDLLGMKHISSANLQPFKRASALVEAKVFFFKSCGELPCGRSIMKRPEKIN